MTKTPTSDRLAYKSFYHRNLPHIQPLNSALFLTFRLAGSLPQEVLRRVADERRFLEQTLNTGSAAFKSRFGELARRHFAILESCLDNATTGPTWLADTRMADLVAEALHHRDGKNYRLDAYSIMPNHVHAIFAPLPRNNIPQSLSSIMHSLKRHTAKRANQVLRRSGVFWAHESFDHYMRNRTEFERIITYVLENPVKAGLVKSWQEWPWNYVRDSLTMRDAN